MPEMTMMQSVGLMMGMLVFLILAVGGILLAFRVYAGREYRHNHPASVDEVVLPVPRAATTVTPLSPAPTVMGPRKTP